MAFASLVLKARRIKAKQRKYFREKNNAILISQGKKTDYTLTDKISHFLFDLKLGIKKWCNRLCSFPKNSCMHKTCVKLRHDGTFENYALKSIVGFIGGFILTYIFFMFFVFTLNFKISTATTTCSIFGTILTLGLAFSKKIRCTILMILPQFFSQRGRQALLAYAFILTLTGPAKNTLRNMGIMSESLACGQEQLRVAAKQILEMIKKPYYAIRDAVRWVVKTVKVIVKKIKEIFLTIKRIIMGIVRVIKSVFQFLGKIFNICSKKVGTPFERCTRVFENAILDCQAKLGPMFSWLCSITYIIQAVCYIVKPLDFICMLLDFINDSIVNVVMRKVRTFTRHVRTIFYVRIIFAHSFYFETTQSKSMKNIAEGIFNEIKNRSQHVMTAFDLMSCATSLFFIVIIINAIYYRYKFLTSERFDNRYIGKHFRHIDFRRAQQRKETLLPLNHRESHKYIPMMSWKLVKKERLKLSRSLVILLSSTFKLVSHMMVDYGLYWILATIRYHGQYKNIIETPRVVGLHIEGHGFLADLYRSVVKAFTPLGVKMEVDTVPCLPDPIPPDFERYFQIGFLILLCWILALFEPYGLRSRNSVMSYYNPTRARERAIWLYNHILRRRQSFLKFARRQLRRKVMDDKSITKVTFIEWLRSKTDNRCFHFFCGESKQVACLLCGRIFRPNETEKPIFCPTPGCSGVYCQRCFHDLKNLCPVCKKPIEYGDLSDMDEEVDSSDNEALERYKSLHNDKRKKEMKKAFKMEESDDDSRRERGGSDLPLDSDLSLDSDLPLDSDNQSDDSNYSFSYQYEESVEDRMVPTRQPFSDIENQTIPDYASMEIFSNELSDESDSLKQLQIEELYYSSSETGIYIALPKMQVLKPLRKFLEKISSFFSPIEKRTESKIPLLDVNSEETSFIETSRRAIDSDVSSSTNICFLQNLSSESSQLQTPKCRTSTPRSNDQEFSLRQFYDSKEELFLNIQDRHKNKHLFKNVNYFEANETAREERSTFSESNTSTNSRSLRMLKSDFEQSTPLSSSKIDQRLRKYFKEIRGRNLPNSPKQSQESLWSRIVSTISRIWK